jgi:hypothetical protein
MNVCVVVSVAMVILLRDFGPYGIIFMREELGFTPIQNKR